MRMILALVVAFSVVPQFARAVDFFDNSTNAPQVGLIQSARRALDIEIYTMDDPQIRDEILRAQARGVRVRIIQDGTPYGSSCQIFSLPSSRDAPLCAELKAFVPKVVRAGGIYVPFNKTVYCANGNLCFEHGKLMIVDGTHALVSTGNFDATSLCDTTTNITRCNRDFSVVTSDPRQIDRLGTIFVNDLTGRPYDLATIANGLPAVGLTVSPFSRAPLVGFIRSATRTIEIENQYLHDPALDGEIVAAAARGVQVRVMVASLCSFGAPNASALQQGANDLQALSGPNLQVRAFTRAISVGGRSGYLHAKAIVVDHRAAWVGSVNGSSTALDQNREFGVFFSDLNAVRALDGILQSDFASPGSTSLSADQHCIAQN